jgi:ribonuclease III
LEYLGDAVLGLVVAEALYAAHPEWREGELTRIRSGLVSRQRMAQVAEAIDLGKHLRLSRGEERSGLRRKSTVLSNTMEAVMGALYLDGGLEPVRAFVRGQVMGEAAERLAVELRSGAALGNYKSALQERLQAARVGAPYYRVKSESGPDHRKVFLVEVRVKGGAGERGKPLARGVGSTIKFAEQDAARRALEQLESAGALASGEISQHAEAVAEPDAEADTGDEEKL